MFTLRHKVWENFSLRNKGARSDESRVLQPVLGPVGTLDKAEGSIWTRFQRTHLEHLISQMFHMKYKLVLPLRIISHTFQNYFPEEGKFQKIQDKN